MIDIQLNTKLDMSNSIENMILLTNKAQFNINDVDYSQADQSLIIPIYRKEIIKFRKGFIYLKRKPKYGKGKKIKAIITVNNIISCDAKNRCDNKIEKITILFGMQVDKNEIYICSSEENMGECLYEISIKVEGLDISIIDQ